MKKIKTKQIINICFIAIATVILIWIEQTEGFPGLVHWNPVYQTYVLCLWALIVMATLIFVLSFLLKKGGPKKVFEIISFIFSIITLAVFIGLLLFVTLPTFGTPGDEYKLNELTNMDQIEVSSEGPLFTLAVSSDPHWGAGTNTPGESEKILQTIKAEDYDAFFCLGDISEMGVTESNYQLACTTFTKYLGDMPILTVMGNHDALVNGEHIFGKYFQTKQDKLYYRVDLGQLHILVLDLLWDSEQFDKAQETWLIEQLENIPEEDMIIALHHCYGWGSGYCDKNTQKKWYDIPDMIDRVDSVLEEYNVELDVSGHNHFLEYLKHANTSYGIVGAMGGIFDKDKDYTSPASIWYNNTTYGFMGIDVYQDRLEITYKDSEGKVLYSATVNNN